MSRIPQAKPMVTPPPIVETPQGTLKEKRKRKTLTIGIPDNWEQILRCTCYSMVIVVCFGIIWEYFWMRVAASRYRSGSSIRSGIR